MSTDVIVRNIGKSFVIFFTFGNTSLSGKLARVCLIRSLSVQKYCKINCQNSPKPQKIDQFLFQQSKSIILSFSNLCHMANIEY